MKRLILSLALLFTVTLTLAACDPVETTTSPTTTTTTSTTTPTATTTTTTTGPGSVLNGSLEDILAAVYENAEIEDTFREFIESGLMTTEITADNIEYHLGTADIEYDSAIASEPIMSTSAYTLCLVRVSDGADIEQIKSGIAENVDPMKWVCVGVDPSNIIVDNIGDVVVLIMSDHEAEQLHDAFLALEA